jgi:glycosyltransferase involved in cell wall biosynthesis
MVPARRYVSEVADTPRERAVVPAASVVVCTRDRRDLLAGCLAALADQRAPDGGYEVVVVDNGSTDGTADLLDAWATTDRDARHVVREPVAGLSRARNAGLAAARGEVVVFLDDDARAPHGWVTAHLAPYAWTPGVDAVGGPVVLRWPSGRPAWITPRLEHWFSALDLGERAGPWPAGHGPYGTNMSVRRATALDIGGFSPSLGRRGRSLLSSEEQEFFERLTARGGLMAYEPAAFVHHEVLGERMRARWVVRRGWAQGRSNARVRARRAHISGWELVSICRTEARHAIAGSRALAGAVGQRDASAVLDEMARRFGHLSGALEQIWLWASHGAEPSALAGPWNPGPP